MNYAMIMAGGSGTRLWPMSRAKLPKQLIPFIKGKSLLQIALERLDGLVPAEQCYICAGLSHQQVIAEALSFPESQYLGEPVGRDTLNAVALGAAVLGRIDPDAVVAVFTADHIIEPIDRFQKIIGTGYKLATEQPNTLVTFGIAPTHAATGYGYLELGDSISNASGGAQIVDQFKEKPPAETAQDYFDAGPEKYLWNSGMFVWRAATLMNCIKEYEPENHDGLMRIAEAWDTPERQFALEEIYPTLKKISVDFAVMEPASKDPDVQVAAVPMPLTWLDVGSWPSFAETCDKDENANALGTTKHLMLDSSGTLVASSDPNHLITTIGCENMVIIHTPDATLVCPGDRAEDIKKLHGLVGEQFSDDLL